MKHAIMLSIGGYWLFQPPIDGMPEPTMDSSPGDKWAFNRLHSLAGHVQMAFANRFPTLSLPLDSAVQVQHKETTTVVAPPQA